MSVPPRGREPGPDLPGSFNRILSRSKSGDLWGGADSLRRKRTDQVRGVGQEPWPFRRQDLPYRLRVWIASTNPALNSAVAQVCRLASLCGCTVQRSCARTTSTRRSEMARWKKCPTLTSRADASLASSPIAGTSAPSSYARSCSVSRPHLCARSASSSERFSRMLRSFVPRASSASSVTPRPRPRRAARRSPRPRASSAGPE